MTLEQNITGGSAGARYVIIEWLLQTGNAYGVKYHSAKYEMAFRLSLAESYQLKWKARHSELKTANVQFLYPASVCIILRQC